MGVVSRENAQVRARDMRFVGSRLSLVGDLKFDPPYQFQSSQGICDSFCLTVALTSGEALNCSTKESISFLSGAIPSLCCMESE